MTDLDLHIWADAMQVNFSCHQLLQERMQRNILSPVQLVCCLKDFVMNGLHDAALQGNGHLGPACRHLLLSSGPLCTVDLSSALTTSQNVLCIGGCMNDSSVCMLAEYK